MRYFLYFLIPFWASTLYSQPVEFPEYRVEHFTTANGLPTNRVFAITEDSLGFLWFGTDNGVVRYDGYEFITYSPDPSDSTSIGNRMITTLLVEEDGTLWVGGGPATPAGLNRFDYRTETFTQFRHDPDNPNSLLNDHVNRIISSKLDPEVIWIYAWRVTAMSTRTLSRLDLTSGTFSNHVLSDMSFHHRVLWDMIPDGEGNVWTGGGSAQFGLFRFNPESGITEHHLPYPRFNAEDPLNQVFGLYEDRNGDLWVSLSEEISRFDKKSKLFSPVASKASDSDTTCYSADLILEDRAGTVWTGNQHGICRLDPQHNRLKRLVNIPPVLDLYWLYEDRFGILWVGTENGLLKVERTVNLFTTYQHAPDNPNSLGDQTARSIYKDSDGIVWIGSGGILNRVDRNAGIVTGYPLVASNINQDESGMLWIGGDTGGLSRMDPQRPGEFTHYIHDPDDPESISAGSFNHSFEDRAGNYWIGFFGFGVQRMDRETGTFHHFTPESHGLIDNSVLRLYEAPSEPGIIWVGTEKGLSRFDTDKEEITNYEIGRSMMMLEDHNKQFWVATGSSGLHLFDRRSGRVLKTYTSREGLAHDVVWSVYEDDQGFLWLSTMNGISKFDPIRDSFRNYTTEDGLPDNNFVQLGKHQSSDGELFFGSVNGAVSFFPEDLQEENITPPDLILTGLQIHGDLVQPGQSAPLESSMLVSEELSLTHAQNDITLEYVGLQFIDPEDILYRYKLEGYDRDWVNAGTQRTARYANLDPGAYTFHVSARSEGSDWADPGASVRIIVFPPWWRTNIAYLMYAFGVWGLGFGGYRWQRQRLIAGERLRAEREKAKAIESTNNELERALKHLTETQDQLIHTEKMASLGQLTAGIAHEIKNPLNFVNNFSRLSVEVIDELTDWVDAKGGMDDPDVSELVETLKMNSAKINEHGQRADGIIRSMLEHSRTGRGDRRAVDINSLVDEYVNLAFHGARAREQGLEVELNRAYDHGAGEVEIYPQEIGRVLINLLDNAFYTVNEKRRSVNEHYTPQVSVSTKKTDNFVELRIQDNGLGIPREIQDKIFDPFFTTKPTGSGTGLGLSLSHDIVVKGHGGTISVESQEGKCTTFVIRIPCG